MAEPSPDKIVIGTIGPLITTVIGAAIGWLPGGLSGALGSALTNLLTAAGAIGGLVFSLMYKRYIGVLGAGAEPKGSPEWKSYDALRKSLRGGNIAARLYADRLTKFLDAVDRFFGDAGKADQTLFPRAFGLKKPAPLWTAPAFDRCLFLALIYPIATILIIWAVSGHVGPAEAALGLTSNVSAWWRSLAIVLLAPCLLTPLWARWTNGLWWIARYASGVAGILALHGAAAGILAVAVTIGIGLIELANFGASMAIFAVAVSVGFVQAPTSGVISFTAIGIASAFYALNWTAVKRQRRGVFFIFMLPVMIMIGFAGTYRLASLPGWGIAGPLLLFLGLLTLINAPFDWASLGLTRALLRRGLELGGWWPYLLALVDALAAAVIIAVLAITMVISVQTFDHLAEYSAGPDARVLPLDKLFDGMAARPSAPEYWWAYALLFSTMIPSLLNLMIGGASLLRGIPGLPALLLRFMPAGKAVPAFNRTWLALVLTCQVFVGAFLGIAAQFVLAVGVIFYVLPWIGLELLDTARAVAEFDLPMRVLGLWWGNP
jgi:hypothetical protein